MRMRAARPTRAGRFRCTSRRSPVRPRAARLLLDYGADVSARELENDAIALGWAAFFGRPAVVEVLIRAGSEVSQRNKHGLTPLGCAVGGTQGRWRKFSDATIDDWRAAAEIIRAHGGLE